MICLFGNFSKHRKDLLENRYNSWETEGSWVSCSFCNSWITKLFFPLQLWSLNTGLTRTKQAPSTELSTHAPNTEQFLSTDSGLTVGLCSKRSFPDSTLISQVLWLRFGIVLSSIHGIYFAVCHEIRMHHFVRTTFVSFNPPLPSSFIFVILL